MDRNLRIGIVGLGLIGGSIFKALCALKGNVIGVCKSNANIEKAKKYCPNVFKSLTKVNNCDIVFVCTPMNQLIETLDKLEKILPSTTIVADVSSLKEFTLQQKRPYIFIPTHPMAGTEFTGFENSFESLFLNTKWVLTPNEKINKNTIKALIDIIEALGATPIYTTAKEHDEAVAIISHMPMLIAQAIFKTAQSNKLALKLASSGFRDMTRLAMTNEELASDMINFNANNIEKAIISLHSNITELFSDKYASQIKTIKKQRSNMYFKGKNIL